MASTNAKETTWNHRQRQMWKRTKLLTHTAEAITDRDKIAIIHSTIHFCTSNCGPVLVEVTFLPTC